jgi:hypothetical protein
LSQGVIIPYAKALYLCDGHLGFTNQKSDLMGIFNAVRPVSYPHLHRGFVVYARLSQGLGAVPFYVDIREAATQQLTHTSNTHQLMFPNRNVTVEMVLTLQVRFPRPGVAWGSRSERLARRGADQATTTAILQLPTRSVQG